MIQRFVILKGPNTSLSTFAHSFKGAESMYKDPSVAKRRAADNGDEIWQIDFTPIENQSNEIAFLTAKRIFTRDKK